MTFVFAIENMSIKIADKVICQKLSTTAKSGEFWAILGCNGVGKSTLMHTLAGIRVPEAGQIFLNEHPLCQFSRNQIAKQIAILMQSYQDSFPSTVLETVLIGRHPYLSVWKSEAEVDYKIATEALKAMGMHGFEQRAINSLSGGERRRVALAAVLAQTPDVYLLDEPIHQLDIKYQIQVLEHFAQICVNDKKIVFTVMHDINLTARYCTHAIMLFDDGTYLIGSVEVLFQKEILEKLYHSRIEKVVTEYGNLWLNL